MYSCIYPSIYYLSIHLEYHIFISGIPKYTYPAVSKTNKKITAILPTAYLWEAV
jgi:hypothetical protein